MHLLENVPECELKGELKLATVAAKAVCEVRKVRVVFFTQTAALYQDSDNVMLLPGVAKNDPVG